MSSVNTNAVEIPYGFEDLDPHPTRVSENPRRVRCYVRGCDQILAAPRRRQLGENCPTHGIRCHHSVSATYSYADVRRNLVASPDLFVRRVQHHPFKYETHRFGQENSEDALSWNVFRSLQETGRLGRIAELITGERSDFEPDLYLWGLRSTGDDFEPWNLLISARERFEQRLPVDRPLTEPDVALHLPGKYLILIEAKFTSPNTCYVAGPRKDRRSLTLKELLDIYHDPRLEILEASKARASSRVYHQLWRNTVFAEWMAKLDHPQTKAYHANLVRRRSETESAVAFAALLKPAFADRFRRITWEEIHALSGDDDNLAPLRRYLETKTAGLLPAFDLQRGNSSGGNDGRDDLQR